MGENIKEIGQETRFSSENQPNNSGRKKNRFAHLKDLYELSSNDMDNIIKYLLSLEKNELMEMAKKDDSPVILIAFASAIIDAIKKGNITQINYMLDRLHGKPKNNLDVDLPDLGDINIIINGRKPDQN